MILKIEHDLIFNYSEKVSLSPHYFYLTAKPTPFQNVIESELEVYPKPKMLVKNIDQEGNNQHVCFINEETENFVIKSKIKIETEDFNPFGFVFFPFETSRIPFEYPDKIKPFVNTYLNKQISESVKQFSQEIVTKVEKHTLNFLIEISKFIKENFKYEKREKGLAYDSETTLQLKAGSCRDFAILMVDACASIGIVARFVSGYCFGNERHSHDLHAWVEVMLPGGGWRGFDPTEGRVVTKNYIALASSIDAEWINPVTGKFRSKTTVNSDLKTNVEINKI
jgi:transglutaminase-like putative cysteine protease